MGSVHYLGRSLDPEAMRAIGAAFDSAWKDVDASDDHHIIDSTGDAADEFHKRRATWAWCLIDGN